ncbi:hypothetical protein MNBD_DELTA02-1129 [hydrothermal vent metagenome]|uniref:Prepilin-type N-terminal cleavage/methylation domain-containing protein n=1 Tax=hydrothermal vent metagenome TaxID=652676 RepID=A0A3B0W4L2_9ZZZZ
MRDQAHNKISEFGPFQGAERGERGFSLLELLVVMSIFLLVISSVYALYNTQLKTTHIEEDVIEVQQNLRVAVDILSRDVAMAGIAVSSGTNPVNAVANNSGLDGSDQVTFNNASADGVFTIVDVTLSVSVLGGTPIVFTVGSATEAEMFNVDDAVRIINSSEKSQPAATVFTVTAKNTATPSLTLKPAVSAGSVKFMRGNLIARTGTSALDPYPNTILYCVGPAVGCAPAVTRCPTGQKCLMRIVNATPAEESVVATNIEDFQLTYILDNTGLIESDLPGDLSLVRAMRITMVGETFNTAGLSSAPKSRELTNIVKLRNR